MSLFSALLPSPMMCSVASIYAAIHTLNLTFAVLSITPDGPHMIPHSVFMTKQAFPPMYGASAGHEDAKQAQDGTPPPRDLLVHRQRIHRIRQTVGNLLNVLPLSR